MSIRRIAKLEKQPKCKNPLCHKKLQLERFQFCSMKCRGEHAKVKDKVFVIRTIRKFFTDNGRIPIKYELTRIYSRARVGYGTWNKAIIAAGYDPNPVMFAKHYLAKDGHKCDSMAEKIVDDWLSTHQIEHQIHIPYPWHNGMKCDFLVDDTWIEIFGLAGEHKRYDQLKKIKLALAKDYNLNILALSLSDVYKSTDLNKKLSRLLSLSRQTHPGRQVSRSIPTCLSRSNCC